MLFVLEQKIEQPISLTYKYACPTVIEKGFMKKSHLIAFLSKNVKRGQPFRIVLQLPKNVNWRTQCLFFTQPISESLNGSEPLKVIGKQAALMVPIALKKVMLAECQRLRLRIS